MPNFDYIVFVIFICISILLAFKQKSFSICRKYAILLGLFLVCIFINALTSKYSPGGILTILGTFFTCIPFVYFILSYNVKMNNNDISKYINLLVNIIIIIYIICYLETFIFGINRRLTGILSTSFFFLGFVASLGNQAIILSLYLYKQSHNKKYLFKILFLAISVFLTFQLKAIAGLIIIAFIYKMFYSSNKTLTILFIVGCLVIAIPITLSIPKFKEKIEKYITLYSDVENVGVARVALYVKSVEIISDFFPLGTGQGTYGSIPANMKDSKVYEDYGLSGVWGLSLQHKVNFRMDTHWSSILGENGALGSFLYISLFLYPVFAIRKVTRKNSQYNNYKFLIVTSSLVILEESITLTIPNRFAFIIIYSGLAAIILRSIQNNVDKYESIANHN